MAGTLLIGLDWVVDFRRVMAVINYPITNSRSCENSLENSPISLGLSVICLLAHTLIWIAGAPGWHRFLVLDYHFCGLNVRISEFVMHFKLISAFNS